MRTVFLDTEYTGEHQHTTLVSLALVSLEGDDFYVTLNDYDRVQVTDWLAENVLAQLDPSEGVTRREALESISVWLGEQAGDESIRLVSAGLGADIALLYQLWEFTKGDRMYFHALHCLPPAINHAGHLDLHTLFSVAGLDPGLDREAFLDEPLEGRRHDALYDARVVRGCYLKLLRDHPELEKLTS